MIFDWPMIQTVGVFAIAGGYIFTQFRKGGNSGYSETINILQARDEAQKQLIADYQSKFEAINKELGILQGQLKEKDGKLTEYLDILKGRDPELTMYIKDSAQELKEIKVFMQMLNEVAGRSEKRNVAIDKAAKKLKE